jgi:Protein of unknown function (DUF3313)
MELEHFNINSDCSESVANFKLLFSIKWLRLKLSFITPQLTMKLLNFMAMAIITLAFCGCSDNLRIPPEHAAAFLDDYVLTQSGDQDNPTISIWKKNVRWSTYNNIQVMPVLAKKHSDLGIKLTHAERHQLTELLEFHMRNALKTNFTLVNSAGDRTLRIDLLITDATVNEELTASFVTIHPSIKAISALTALLNNSDSFGGKASVVAKITDSATGDLLMVATDANDALRELGNSSSLWSRQLSYQLCQKQQRGYCFIPQMKE